MRTVFLVLVVGWFGGAALYRAMASDETKIRWVFEDEAAAFNGMALLVSMEGFASDYRDTTRGITRQQLRRDKGRAVDLDLAGRLDPDLHRRQARFWDLC